MRSRGQCCELGQLKPYHRPYNKNNSNNNNNDSVKLTHDGAGLDAGRWLPETTDDVLSHFPDLSFRTLPKEACELDLNADSTLQAASRRPRKAKRGLGYAIRFYDYSVRL